ncbi:MAG: hydantoinase B/oxoprolinase family protein [Alphaproteobacteria bacterium]|nr:hydantoinase B/oxoprolinase family protein [Alphaproteobacteria bacterium]
MALDPVALALVQKRLDHITRQMGWVMIRTARSPVFSHAHDFSCFLTDPAGTVIAQADGIPVHTGGGGFAARAMVKFWGDAIGPEDAILLNDPFTAGGNHLPDWVIARPIHVGTERVGFACIRAHQSDIGGGAAGAYNPTATEIFHEGIRLPPLRLMQDGHIKEDVWQLLMINTRTPHLLDGDVRAMLGATRIGADHVAALFNEHGVAEGRAYIDGVLDHAERRMRAAIAALPDGVYVGEDHFDDDCFEDQTIPIRATVTIKGDAMTVDFTGSHPQIKGFKNSSLANTYSSVYVGLASFFATDIPRNEGTFRAVTVIAPEGSIVNARAPAPTTMCTLFPACEIVHAVWNALAQADPERGCAGWGSSAFPITSGLSEAGETFVMYHWCGTSGGGAVEGRDGFPQQGGVSSLSGLIIPNAETFEQLFPVRIRHRRLRLDAAGAGKFRGGAGVDYEVDVYVAVQMTFRGEGRKSEKAFGAAGGGAGKIGRMTVTPQEGAAIDPPSYGIIHTKGPVHISLQSPGGGGYGSPRARAPELVLLDVRDGIVSRAAAAEAYGVVLATDGRSVDAVATARLRATASA